MMLKPQWRLKLRLFSAKILIKMGKLRHASYSKAELKAIVDAYLPETFEIEVPQNKGELTLLKAELNLPRNKNVINLQLFSKLHIGAQSKPLYRAHIIIRLEVHPIYDAKSYTLRIDKMRLNDVQLVNDEYSLIEDSRDLLGIVFPKPLQGLLSETVMSAVGFITAGASDAAANYMKLYLSGSKQRILDYHKPQIETLVNAFAERDEAKYQLDTSNFEMYLFSVLGKKVVVEEGELRFKF